LKRGFFYLISTILFASAFTFILVCVFIAYADEVKAGTEGNYADVLLAFFSVSLVVGIFVPTCQLKITGVTWKNYPHAPGKKQKGLA
jgi:hypothetical protein